MASRALQALTGGTTLTDITLQGSVTYIAGSDRETGSATLVARGDTESLLTLNLSGGQRKEVHNGAAGVWIGPDGTPRAVATFNCYLDTDWFFPAFSLGALATDPTLIINLAGQEVHGGQQVYHLTLFHYPSGQPPDVVSLVQRVSKMDIFLDATSLMPTALDFNVHPDNNANFDIPMEIRFGAYQSFSGVWAPTRIRKYLQNYLVLDITTASVAVNSSVADSVFALPAVPTVNPARAQTPSGGNAN